ncbi:MAG: AAA family ATPase [bacterium]|nr:AAA family ATPase [bacterium]
MLCQFGFKNFKSYKNETIFDFQAGELSEFKESLIKDDKATPLLPVSVVYGPNGGGKTTLLQALSCLITMVVFPIHELKKNRMNLIVQQRVNCEPFLYDEKSKNEPTEFNLYFRKNNNEYRYYVAIKNDIVVAESLFRRGIGAKKTAVIFTREENNIDLGASIGKSGINTDVNPKMLFLSFLAINYNISVIVEVQEWFESCVIRNYANPITDLKIMINENESFKKPFLNLLNEMGIDVCDYRYDSEKEDFLLMRKVNNVDYSLSLSKESAGTRKLFGSLPILMIALQTGRLAIIDELDAKLHPKLLRYIISLFTDPKINKFGAQLLFTSHDMSTMSNEVFRRDEIWFAALDDEHSSELYSLYEIRKEDGKRVNATASYNKQYLEGRYGADPYFKKMLDWGDWA